MKLQTPVESERLGRGFGYKDKILFLGSCFADEIGGRCGKVFLDVNVNPFGVLFNPCSVADTLGILSGETHFSEDDIVRCPAGYCSFHHHTSFARETAGEFLENANSALDSARSFLKASGWVALTLGTAFVYRYKASGTIVANCLKLPGSDFERELISPEDVYNALSPHIGSDSNRQWILTVSPVRHIADGLHMNQLSKAVLQLGLSKLVGEFPNAHYFPSYEIVLDELRDYRFYAEDMAHPSSQCADYVFERFMDYALDLNEQPRLARARHLAAMSGHRPLHPDSEQAIEFERRLDSELSGFLAGIGRDN